ncbi:hypothetical protein EYD45_07510 [Hyunsoonleella flava]|uniref:Uncharacterized protein n=2 Tax=Hyunsoonleella flava TaxID=2527939 RepID=A0A4Q9FH23_9FLAO|nr:hypothetical protein EYD45_07510 [Hyunsoonleella flava]
MIVVIIITTIVVGMAFSVLAMVQKHMKGIQANFNKTLEIEKLEQVLNIDFNRHTKIEYDTINDELFFISEIDTVAYQFTENHVITPMDTLHIPLHHKQFFFNGLKVNYGRIDAIKLETTKTFLSQNVFVYKRNDATLFLD